MKFNKNEFGWKEKVSVNTNLNNDTFNIKFLPDMNTNSNMYIVNAVDLEEKTTYRVNMNSNKKSLTLRYIFSDGTFKTLYGLASKYLLGKVEIYIYRKTDTLIEFDVDYDKYIRYTCNIDEANKTVEITKKALILGTDNKQEYTPTSDYHPATKKYVDDKFVMNENIETIYTIPMSEMQKCNNGTSMYVSSIDFDELFINHEKYIYYANYKDETLIPVKYDSIYNRFTTGVLDDLGSVDLALGFDLSTNRMYPFNGGMAVVKAYTFTNDLVIKRVPILNANEVATREYVDEKSILEPLPIYDTVESESSLLYIVNIMDLDKRKTYGAVQHGIDKGTIYRFVYICDDGSKAMITSFGDGVNENPIRVWHNTNSSTLYYGNYYYNIDYTNHTTRKDVVVTQKIQRYLNINNNIEYTPSTDYHPATKKYVDDNDKRMLEYVYNGKVLKITLTAEQEERLSTLESGEYIVLDSVSPEDIYKFTSDDSIDWCGCVLINNISFNVISVGNLQINAINSGNAIKIYTENTYYDSSTQAGTFRYNYSLAVLDNTEQVVLVKCDDVEYHYASTEYINNILSFNESGELVVTINGVSKIFVPKQ